MTKNGNNAIDLLKVKILLSKVNNVKLNKEKDTIHRIKMLYSKIFGKESISINQRKENIKVSNIIVLREGKEKINL